MSFVLILKRASSSCVVVFTWSRMLLSMSLWSFKVLSSGSTSRPCLDLCNLFSASWSFWSLVLSWTLLDGPFFWVVGIRFANAYCSWSYFKVSDSYLSWALYICSMFAIFRFWFSFVLVWISDDGVVAFLGAKGVKSSPTKGFPFFCRTLT